jgi:hypothetical protein
VTLIITGAIYGLIAGGQNAFRREPALTERQQSIRMAMDSIVRDIENAGSFGAGPFDKVFTPDVPVNSMDNPGVALGSWPSATVAGERADFLEMMVNDGMCPTMTVCEQNGANLFVKEPFPTCMQDPSLAYVYGPNGGATKTPAQGQTGVVYVFNRDDSDGGPPTCPNAAAHINTPAGQSWLNPSGALDCGGSQCTGMVAIQIVRYEVAPCAAAGPESQVPCLWRSPVGRTNMADGTLMAAGPPGAPWQQIARGIEDMQVQYRAGAAAWSNDADVPIAGDYTTTIREVRVTLSARAVSGNIAIINGVRTDTMTQAGLTTAANIGTAAQPNPTAVRGRLTTVVAPRAMLRALMALTASPKPSPQPWN